MVIVNSAKGVDAVRKPGYHRFADGLHLQALKQGTKSWLYRYKSPVTRKQREMGLGSLNFVSLAEARQLAISQKRVVIDGKDPIEERKRSRMEQQLLQARTLLFAEVAQACITSKSPEWKSAKHAQQWTKALKTYAFPVIGHLTISEITTDLILKILEPIWVEKAQVA